MIDLYTPRPDKKQYTFQQVWDTLKNLPGSVQVRVTNPDNLDRENRARFFGNCLTPQKAAELLFLQFWQPAAGNHMYRLAEEEVREIVVRGKTYLEHRINLSIGGIIEASGHGFPSPHDLVIPGLPNLKNTFIYVEPRPVKGRLTTLLSGLKRAG